MTKHKEVDLDRCWHNGDCERRDEAMIHRKRNTKVLEKKIERDTEREMFRNWQERDGMKEIELEKWVETTSVRKRIDTNEVAKAFLSKTH